MNRCAICSSTKVEKWINPSNPEDFGYYCHKHFESISKAFGNFKELTMLIKVPRGKLP